MRPKMNMASLRHIYIESRTVIMTPASLYIPLCPDAVHKFATILYTHEVIAFRPPLKGESFLATTGTVDVAHYNFSENAPRLILIKRRTSRAMDEARAILGI